MYDTATSADLVSFRDAAIQGRLTAAPKSALPRSPSRCEVRFTPTLIRMMPSRSPEQSADGTMKPSPLAPQYSEFPPQNRLRGQGPHYRKTPSPLDLPYIPSSVPPSREHCPGHSASLPADG